MKTSSASCPVIKGGWCSAWVKGKCRLGFTRMVKVSGEWVCRKPKKESAK
jgi:hypothetical protein